MPVVAILLISGCSDGVATGSAISPQYGQIVQAKPIRPGVELGFLFAYLNNRSNAPIVLRSITLRGRGVGGIVRPMLIEIAPQRDGYHRYQRDSVPGAIYDTNPPVLLESGRCRKQKLLPARGFRMIPGSQARIFVVLRAVKPGSYKITAHVVSYLQDGGLFKQSLPTGMSGSVTKTAKHIPPDSIFAKCVTTMGSHYLPGHHAPEHAG